MDEAHDRLRALVAPLTNYERTRPDQPRWSLDTMRALLAGPGFALPEGLLVQIGGSKGKGTTALYLESLARAAGLRVGTYLSPHLQSLRERVRLDGMPAEAATLERHLRATLAQAKHLGLQPSFFEVMTHAALGAFADAGVDLGILEVGLGGRLDATTAVPVDASIVTVVELEHTELLGDTVEAIAGEKAHVLRADRPGFTGATGGALQVLRQRAAAVRTSLHEDGTSFGLEALREDATDLRGVFRTVDGRRQPFALTGAAAFERPALSLAAACLATLAPDRPLPLDPVPRPTLPGRFEVLACPDGAPLVLDGAHTERSARALAEELERRYPGRRPWIAFASAAGKRWRDGLKWLAPRADRVVVTALTGTQSEPPEAIADWLRSQGTPCEVAVDVPEALARLMAGGELRVVTGSFYLVGSVRSQLSRFGVDVPA
ncbi:MAG: cyanophycin synthetase [Planctomycetota bacterium]